MKNFRVRRADGRVVGISEMSPADARRNLGPGEVLVPFDPSVSPDLARWADGEWVAGPAGPGRVDDYRFMRASGYDIGAQVGALMKVVEALIADPEVSARLPPDVRAEFAALSARNAVLKNNHPRLPRT